MLSWVYVVSWDEDVTRTGCGGGVGVGVERARDLLLMSKGVSVGMLTFGVVITLRPNDLRPKITRR